MKKFLYIILLLPFINMAQTPSQNYVRTLTYREGTTTSDLTKAQANITYFDGIGRPIQQIIGKASANGKDIVTHIEYDKYGRQPKEYLPYEGTGSILEFENSALSSTLSFYADPYYESTPNPYTQKFYEASPLNRMLKQGAPGAAWQGNPTTDNDHTIKFSYLSNSTADNVKHLRALASWNNTNKIYNISFQDYVVYATSDLYKTVTKDENWVSGTNNTTEEYKNQQGQVVLKRTYNAGVIHDTYYVYDQFGNLTYVLPPKAEGGITYLNDLCYQYKYDSRNRLAEKKLPGKAWEYIVYDNLDRVVATGPALSPFGNGEIGWMYNYYDSYNRLAFTGWAKGSVDSPSRVDLQGTGTVINVGRGAGSIDNVAIDYKLDFVPPSNFRLLTVNYYDNYLWLNSTLQPTTSTLVEGINVLLNVKNLPTGGWVRAVTTQTETFGETSYIYYDAKARPIRTSSTNYLGGYTTTDTKLDFDGTTIYTITKHKRTSSSTELVTREDFTYTPQDRLLSHTHKINAGVPQLMSYNTYDKLGQLINKNTGGQDNTGFSCYQSIDYVYNIRGWLKAINNPSSSLGGTPITGFTDLFAFKINYNEPITESVNGQVVSLYNGNISETYWRSSSDNILRKYGYKYDNLNRLTTAIYQKPNDAVPVTQSYNESLTYDKNGNIMSLLRNGDLDSPTTTVQTDNLTYTYPAGSNKLEKVADSTNSPSGFKDSPDNNSNDYTYDVYGNMKSDRNKGITNITYNHLNLPVEIVFDNSTTKKISYIYNALGVKVKKKVTDGTVITEVDYLQGGYQYKDGILSFFPTSEGYVESSTGALDGTRYNYVYQYKDHLGNVRLSYVFSPPRSSGSFGTLRIKEENNYYPFGLKHGGYNVDASVPVYKYKYQEQEFQDELGLNWYSFKWRNEDPAIGRFVNIDPLAEVYEWQSVYAFGSNQPVHAKELEGMESEKDLSGNNRSWSFSNFVEGAREAVEDISVSSSLGPFDLRNDINSLKSVGKGDFEGAAKSTSIYQIGKTVLDAFSGDDKAQGKVAVVVIVAVATKRAAGKTAAARTSTTAAAEASEASASRTGGNAKAVRTGGLPKPGKGKGTIPPSQRDPKRIYTPKEKSQLLEKQDGKCAQCGEEKNIKEVEGHHIQRHADGGATTQENGAALCKTCHKEIHQ